MGLDPAWPGFRAHGYPEIAAYRAGRIDRETMESRLNQVTRNYVKRQFTWFRRLKGAEWLALADDESPETGAGRAAVLFQAAGPVSGV